ncbi:MAG: alpha-glucuronidase [Prevotella sp.]|nr:alpha-glucuronidase [Prevotella sp.]
MKKTFLLFATWLISMSTHADDGHKLWLGHWDTSLNSQTSVTANAASPTIDIARAELTNGYQRGNVKLVLDKKLALGDGFRLQAHCSKMGSAGNYDATVYASTDIGLLYGTYDLLRLQNTGALSAGGSSPRIDTDGHDVDKTEQPFYPLRLLNHWDNLDGSIERGYAGESIFEWFHLDKELIGQYARANASIGINGSVLNNVNASPKILTHEYLKEVQTIADILRPYGIRVFLSINFASPMALGDTKTADPLNPQVRQWWKKKAQEIYKLIPDFGGFLVKANSEGQPGPGDYHRSHADGANMLADALKPYKGIVMWRCFVYGANHKGEDRVKQAVSEFKPLDGKFRDNVILQTKNGPLDFQPREPYSPVFDQIHHTPNMVELQITQEYLGQSRHLVYLAPMWREFFLQVSPYNIKGIAGVANIGKDKNWCGHHFSQANWYAFGRLAWNPDLTSEEIAREWLKQTFCHDATFINTMTEVMMASREACVDYMMPLGLHHIFKFDHHYGPEPDGFKAEYPIEWCPVYYHKADTEGVGFNRSSTGTDAVSQYREPFASLYDNIDTCPDEYLLWFHHVPWTHRMKSGRTLWQELNVKYNHGVSEASRFLDTWQRMKPIVTECDGDDQRWNEVNDRLKHQAENAREWRDVCLKYFQSFSKQPIIE